MRRSDSLLNRKTCVSRLNSELEPRMNTDKHGLNEIGLMSVARGSAFTLVDKVILVFAVPNISSCLAVVPIFWH
jgi:hypothetical protein